MVSGFFTSPWDHSRIFSGDASEIRIALNDSGSRGFSKKLKMYFTKLLPSFCDSAAQARAQSEAIAHIWHCGQAAEQAWTSAHALSRQASWQSRTAFAFLQLFCASPIPLQMVLHWVT